MLKKGNSEKEAQQTDAFELESVNNAVLMERLEKIERRIMENKFISERFKLLAKEGNLVSSKQLSEIVGMMQTQTKGLNYIDAVQKLAS